MKNCLICLKFIKKIKLKLKKGLKKLILQFFSLNFNKITQKLHNQVHFHLDLLNQNPIDKWWVEGELSAAWMPCN